MLNSELYSSTLVPRKTRKPIVSVIRNLLGQKINYRSFLLGLLAVYLGVHLERKALDRDDVTLLPVITAVFYHLH